MFDIRQPVMRTMQQLSAAGVQQRMAFQKGF